MKQHTLLKHFRNACLLTLVATSVTCGYAQTPDTKQAPPDPIVGRWLWFNNETKIFLADGTASGQGAQGTWKQIGKSTPPKYEFTWNQKFVDTLYLKGNGKELTGKNQQGKKISAQRISEKP